MVWQLVYLTSLYDAEYYSQYAEDAGIYFKKDEEFMKQINKILDQEAVRIIYSEKSETMGQKNSWENIIKQYNSHFVKG